MNGLQQAAESATPNKHSGLRHHYGRIVGQLVNHQSVALAKAVETEPPDESGRYPHKADTEPRPGGTMSPGRSSR
jgi:hypothetical protein